MAASQLLSVGWYPWDISTLNPNLKPYLNHNHSPYLTITLIILNVNFNWGGTFQ
jgi:hypothetical protein